MQRRNVLFALSPALLLLLATIASPTRADDAAPNVVKLYPPGAPTLQGAGEQEKMDPAVPRADHRIYSIRNVHVPSIEVHLAPADRANGTAIIVAPGGGHEQLVWASEGTDIANWLNQRGISAFVLKYRLAKTPGYHYTVEGDALQDTQRALRIVRARAAEWKIDPTRVGILGFSAGGALAALADIRFDHGKADAADPVERQSCRPDFVGLVYAGWEPMNITAPRDAAPAFLTSAGSDDTFHARETVDFYLSLFNAGVPADLHIYAHGGHGGAISARKGIPFGTWQDRFQDWMADLGLLKTK
jgi:acetyl esterase/lipase